MTNKEKANHLGALITEKDPTRARQEEEKVRTEAKACLEARAEVREARDKALTLTLRVPSALSVTSQDTRGPRAIASFSCSRMSAIKSTSEADLPRWSLFTAFRKIPWAPQALGSA